MSSQTTWLAGGGDSGVYDPVTTTDGFPQTGGDVRFSAYDDSWPGINGKGRIYNYGTYRRSGLKALCDEIRNRSSPKCLIVAALTTVAFMLIVLIIAIAKSHHPTKIESHIPADSPWVSNPWVLRTTGLNFIPVGNHKTDLFKFSPYDNATYNDYVLQLTSAMNDYSTAFFHNHTYVECNTTYQPDNETCHQPITQFGPRCTTSHHFGYFGGQPCMLLTFHLPKDYTMQALRPLDGEVYTRAEKVLGERFSIEHVGISCDPIPEDSDKVNVSGIVYRPATGFPEFFFQPRKMGSFVPPAVMVQFNSITGSLHDKRSVRFTCTAWGRMFNGENKLVSPSGMFNTTFAFLIE